MSKEMLAEQLLGREIPMIEISAKEELGIQELEKTLEKNVFKGQVCPLMMKYTLQISDRKQHFSLREKVCIK